MVQREVGIGEGLRFHALAGIHHQQGAFAGLQAARHFIAEVDVARGVDQIELVEVAVLSAIVEADGMGLDGDAAFALQIHRVQNLLHHLARREGAGDFQQTVGECRLAVVDVRNDREVSD